jgi:hypothetical protein
MYQPFRAIVSVFTSPEYRQTLTKTFKFPRIWISLASSNITDKLIRKHRTNVKRGFSYKYHAVVAEQLYLATLRLNNSAVLSLSSPKIVRPYLPTVCRESAKFSTAFLSVQLR